MILIDGRKYACSSCIKGHRASHCHHKDRELFEIFRKGRPITQCSYCRERRKTNRVHIKCVCRCEKATIPKCNCGVGAECLCCLPSRGKSDPFISQNESVAALYNSENNGPPQKETTKKIKAPSVDDAISTIPNQGFEPSHQPSLLNPESSSVPHTSISANPGSSNRPRGCCAKGARAVVNGIQSNSGIAGAHQPISSGASSMSLPPPSKDTPELSDPTNVVMDIPGAEVPMELPSDRVSTQNLGQFPPELASTLSEVLYNNSLLEEPNHKVLLELFQASQIQDQPALMRSCPAIIPDISCASAVSGQEACTCGEVCYCLGCGLMDDLTGTMGKCCSALE
ncbi:uncharacterized protein VTP21DRAFT_8663 [Calcarisporiella thermophila]|uniref:uncharacterized protein n=1 Tax=Calcarisporiella thermophila TaxID=911321 RepID=UPI003742D9B7